MADKGHGTRTSFLALLMAALALCAWLPAGQAAEIQAMERDRDARLKEMTVHPALSGARLQAAPAIEAGASAMVSVQTAGGAPLPGVSVLVNGLPFDTDESGRANVQIPNAGAVTLALTTADKQEIESKTYVLADNGLLVFCPDAAPFIEKLFALIPSRSRGPSIAFAPLLLEGQERFVVIGRNFSGKAGGDQVFVDGLESEILSASTCSLLAVSPARLSPGPVKELYVKSQGESSNIFEVDVCRLQLSHHAGDIRPGRTFPGRLSVVGSNFPALVELENLAAENFQIGLPGGSPLGTKTTLVTPGSDDNFLPLELSLQKGDKLPVHLHLLTDTPELSGDDEGLEGARQRYLWQDLNRLLIIKIKRRLLAVEERLDQEKRKRDELSGDTDTVDRSALEKSNSTLRALSLRQTSLTAMLNAQKALFESWGASEEEFRQAIDDAAGGAYYVLEKSVGQTAFVAAGQVIQSRAQDGSLLSETTDIRRKSCALPEPRIKLLPPLDIAMEAPVPSGCERAGTQKPEPAGSINNLLPPVEPLDKLPAGKSAIKPASRLTGLPEKNKAVSTKASKPASNHSAGKKTQAEKPSASQVKHRTEKLSRPRHMLRTSRKKTRMSRTKTGTARVSNRKKLTGRARPDGKRKRTRHR